MSYCEDSILYCENTMTFDKLMLDFIKDNKSLFIVYIIMLLIQPVRDILMPHMIGKLYTAIKEQNTLHWILTTIICIVLVIQALYIVSDYVDVKLYPLIHKFVREQILMHIFDTKATSYDDIEVGQIITKIVKLPTVFFNFVDQLRASVIPSLITLLFATIYFLWVDCILGGLLLLIILALIYMIARAFSRCTHISCNRDVTFSTMFGDVDDILQNMITVLNFNKINDELARLDQYQQRYTKFTEDTLTCSLIPKYVIVPLMLFYVLFLCIYCYQKVKLSKMDISVFITLVIIVFVVMSTVFSLLSILKDLIMRWGVIKNSLQVFEKCEPQKLPSNEPARIGYGIHMQDVHYKYITKAAEKVIFSNFNLTLHFNEVTVILGEIGSGKSTLINLLLKYQIPQVGEIFINGFPYSRIDHRVLRNVIAYLPQSPILLNRSVYENIVYGLNPEEFDRNKVTVTMQELGLQGFLQKLPNGVDTQVGVHGSKLSGGQRQIVWIIKAVLLNPQIIIMDEPTASIDNATKGTVHYLLEKVMAGKTVIMITHDDYLLRFANRVITLNEGNVVRDEQIY